MKENNIKKVLLLGSGALKSVRRESLTTPVRRPSRR